VAIWPPTEVIPRTAARELILKGCPAGSPPLLPKEAPNRGRIESRYRQEAPADRPKYNRSLSGQPRGGTMTMNRILRSVAGQARCSRRTPKAFGVAIMHQASGGRRETMMAKPAVTYAVLLIASGFAQLAYRHRLFGALSSIACSHSTGLIS
jgi:hypothetical protein